MLEGVNCWRFAKSVTHKEEMVKSAPFGAFGKALGAFSARDGTKTARKAAAPRRTLAHNTQNVKRAPFGAFCGRSGSGLVPMRAGIGVGETPSQIFSRCSWGPFRHRQGMGTANKPWKIYVAGETVDRLQKMSDALGRSLSANEIAASAVFEISRIPPESLWLVLGVIRQYSEPAAQLPRAPVRRKALVAPAAPMAGDVVAISR